MKKVFKSKTFYLALLFLINTSLFIVLCVSTFKNDKSYIDFVPSTTNSFIPTTGFRYEVRKKNFVVFDSYDGIISENGEMYSTYILDSCEFSIGSKVEKDERIGKLNDTIVYSTFESICIDILLDSENNCVAKFYNFNQFLIEITLTPREYTSINFAGMTGIYFSGNGYEYNVSFDGYDYDLLEEKSIISARFRPVNCDSFITKKSEVSIKVKKKEYFNQLYLPASVFDDSICSKSFYIIENSDYKLIYIDSIYIIDNYALIQCDNYILNEGLYLYI